MGPSVKPQRVSRSAILKTDLQILRLPWKRGRYFITRLPGFRFWDTAMQGLPPSLIDRSMAILPTKRARPGHPVASVAALRGSEAWLRDTHPPGDTESG